jgi:1,6-anhydro-N-acetylmuramate kinase
MTTLSDTPRNLLIDSAIKAIYDHAKAAQRNTNLAFDERGEFANQARILEQELKGLKETPDFDLFDGTH